MAKAYLDANPPYVIVERGDTLGAIAKTYTSASGGASYQRLAAINNIPNANLIYVGQKIFLTEAGGSSTSPSSSSNSNTVTIEQFGHQSDSNGTLFVTWSWDKSNTENYKVEWSYDTGDSVWFIGTDSTTEHKQSTYSIPSNAKKVRVRIKPVSKTYTSNDKTTSYWTAEWSTYKTCTVDDITPPKVPPAPTVELEKLWLTASLDNLDVNADSIQFKVIQDNNITYKIESVTITTGHASYKFAISLGHQYKVTCRSYNGTVYSDWSEYSDNYTTIPSNPPTITVCRPTTMTSVHLEWDSVLTSNSYTIEYTTKVEYFEGSDQVTSITGIESNSYDKTGLESGQYYYFRVRAVNDQGESAWSEVVSVVMGKKPSPPTTWSSTTTAITGEDLTFYWVHNSEDGSKQRYANLEFINMDDDTTFEITINSNNEDEDEDEPEKTSFYIMDTSRYSEGAKILWRVRTAGITNQYSDWSIKRTVDIYEPVTLDLRMIDGEGNAIDVLTSFPAYISGLAGPSSQIPIGYHLSVISNEVYDTVDKVGNKTIVNVGQEVYSKYFDITDSLMVELSASNIDLENNVNYTVKCVVSMNSGLTAEASLPFTVSWTDISYTPNARISVDEDNYVTHISPFCRSYKLVNYKVTLSNDKYTKTSTVINRVYGEIVKNKFTTTGEQVYKGVTSSGEDTIYYCQVEESETVKDISLSVYRREFDGRFTELATGLVNGKDTFITDPHPALDYARYRIVATTNATGAVSYYDLPGYPIGGKAAIIQWDEAWNSFNTTSEDALDEPAWTGSMLKLPYNIDVSDVSAPDVELIEYIGREYPVDYYGTQRGFTSTWNVEIEADDEETLYTIRRLQNWMGSAYVREPSGSGYWASVRVSFSQKHCALTIPVTFTITRVEGGV